MRFSERRSHICKYKHLYVINIIYNKYKISVTRIIIVYIYSCNLAGKFSLRLIVYSEKKKCFNAYVDVLF